MLAADEVMDAAHLPLQKRPHAFDAVHVVEEMPNTLARAVVGRRGAFRMGLDHGAYCLGCCWFLMALLFFGGVMNLYWIAGLAVFVLLEKTLPLGHWVGRLAGVLLIVGAGALVLRTI
jgi:predicted metal-binding membrane protein